MNVYNMTNFEIKYFLSLFPDSLMNLSAEEQETSILLYQLLAKGSPVSMVQIAEKSGQTIVDIESIFNRWGSEVHWDENKNIVGFFGLCLNKTSTVPSWPQALFPFPFNSLARSAQWPPLMAKREKKFLLVTSWKFELRSIALSLSAFLVDPISKYFEQNSVGAMDWCNTKLKPL